jgi:hypothetical protein
MLIDPTKASDSFDFEFGKWSVWHRRLKERLVGCTDWEEFSGQSETRPVLGGNGNIEDNVLNFPGGIYRAIAIRSFDPASQTWAIWWLATNNPHHLDVPVIGRFDAGVGAFFADEILNGTLVRVRFLWLRTDTDSPRWEQAMSVDGGTTWETNWTMDFVRE